MASHCQHGLTVKNKESFGSQQWIQNNPEKLIAGIFCRPVSVQLE
jgi:hypothetical protein